MKFNLKISMFGLTIAGFLALVFATHQGIVVNAGGGEKIDATAPVHDFQDYGRVLVMGAQDRGISAPIRNAEGISMNLQTADLPVGAYSVWWVIFNNPSKCTMEHAAVAIQERAALQTLRRGPFFGQPAESWDPTGTATSAPAWV